MTLYDISAEIRKVIARAEDRGGELNEDDLKAIDELTPRLDQKVDAYCALIREWEAAAKAKRNEVERLMVSAVTDENSAKRLRQRLQDCLKALNVGRYDTALFKAWRQKSPPSGRFEGDASKLPDELKRVTVTPDMTALMLRFKETGELVEGFTVTVNEHLRIK